MKMCFCVRYTDRRRPRDVAHRFGFGGYAGGVALDAADEGLSDGLGDEDVARAIEFETFTRFRVYGARDDDCVGRVGEEGVSFGGGVADVAGVNRARRKDIDDGFWQA